jgi:cell division protein FtsB
VLAVAILLAGLWALTHVQRIKDQIAVLTFAPSAQLETYADRTTLTSEGRFLFFASRPVVETGAAFNAVCASQREDVGILGCYLHNDQSIHLFDVTDARLDGLEEVVAAHELLHAAWDRMSAAEQSALEPLLEAEAAKHESDPAFAKTLAYYATAEPGERDNELHSIIGTEFASVSPQLQAHYALYFSDRAAIVAMHEKSDAVFTAQQQQITALQSQLDALSASITSDYAAYNAGYDQLGKDIADFNARANNGSFTSQSQFDSERAALIARQSALDADYASIAARQTQYNALLDQLRALNAQAEDLNRSINISPHQQTGF